MLGALSCSEDNKIEGILGEIGTLGLVNITNSGLMIYHLNRSQRCGASASLEAS